MQQPASSGSANNSMLSSGDPTVKPFSINTPNIPSSNPSNLGISSSGGFNPVMNNVSSSG